MFSSARRLRARQNGYAGRGEPTSSWRLRSFAHREVFLLAISAISKSIEAAADATLIIDDFFIIAMLSCQHAAAAAVAAVLPPSPLFSGKRRVVYHLYTDDTPTLTLR